MKDKDKTKEQIITMLRELRQREIELQKTEANLKRPKKRKHILQSPLKKHK